MATVMFKKFEIMEDDGSIVLRHYDDVGSGGPQVAASYEIALDPEFKNIVDATYFNTHNLEEWSSPLPRIGGPDGTYYTNEEKMYARGKIYCGRVPPGFQIKNWATDKECDEACDKTGTIFYSTWSEIAIGTQTYQEVTITEEGVDDIHTNSDVIGMTFNAIER